MKTIKAEEIQQNLNSLGLPLSFVQYEEIAADDDDNAWCPGNGKIRNISEFREISEYRDIIEINRLWIEEKLKKIYNIFSGNEKENLLYKILVASLTECKISETLPDVTPSDRWWVNIEDTASGSVSQELMGFIKSRDTRRMLYYIIPHLFDTTCNTFMNQMNLQFPERSSIVTPDWVTHYLKGDRHTQSWFYNTPMGKGLFLVLYTKRCLYGKCTGCNLDHLGCQGNVNSNLINHQIETAICKELLKSEKKEIKEIIFSNNGSTFDKKTLPPASLFYFVSKVSHEFSNLKKIIFETRIEHVTQETLTLIKGTLEFDGKNIQVELAVGVELFDDAGRNKHYRKGLDLKKLEELAEKLGYLGIQLRCYMMYKPLVGMTRQQADDDIAKAAHYFEQLSRKHNIDLTMHLNPTFVAIDTPLVEAFKRGEYTPPDLGDLRKLLLSLGSTRLKIYVGLNDEGLAVPGGSFIKAGCEEDLDKLKKFNFTGDFQQLG